MSILNDLAEHYVTDKRNGDSVYKGHNYTEFYEKWFSPIKDSTKDLLEIGILKHPDTKICPYEGASLLMWNDYFTNATIHGIDIMDHKGMNKHGKDRIKIYIGDQADREQLKNVMESQIGKPMDIIIDDGGHWMHQQQISLAFLFKYVKSGGTYVVEDLFTSHLEPPFTPFANQLTKEDTLTQDMLHDFVKTRKMVSMFMKPEEIKYLEENINECIIEKGRMSEIAFITKK
jgi:hypothetical protein